ncbi:fumarylacetoacetate hydrolase family protein [Aestuariivirga litoralis]|uniref:fumarylacetoacetate hydrolase family protein n=1 Tax=Aestuariivirga litoralis TaxID=2650924 RepID=UPI0018C5B8CE|nr:fumarylacetoacetate hydrolase family protein [Aestuariivirga litoralis]MBG1233056.1 fumarylacetoacetate hydrolase family protein [Aestuariivirga litoralis]
MSHPDLPSSGILAGRVWLPKIGPAVVKLEGDKLVDVTKSFATMRDLCEEKNPAKVLKAAKGKVIGKVADVLANAAEKKRKKNKPWLLSPIDLQAVKAAGVTFAASMLERVIEERTRGDASAAASVRGTINDLVGGDLRAIKPGSDKAAALKAALIKANAWSQYLEVGIGPDAEIFTKAPVLSSVAHNMEVGIHPKSSWNNPEPEIVMVVSSTGKIVGATLGNDVNLRDFEGRSALLLGKAKDNNASASLGPFIRFFDKSFSLDDVRKSELAMKVSGKDGFVMEGHSNMALISRDPQEIVANAINEHHQYPDGLVVYLGTMFAPTDDRGEKGKGFTHHVGDVVEISTPLLGVLRNRVVYTNKAPKWNFGLADFMRNIAKRKLL